LWNKAVEEWKHEMTMINVPENIHPKKFSAARAGTLVVCPLIAISQWKSEIEKFSAPGTVSVGIYHGNNRTSAMPAEMMRKFDIVLTTYQVLEQEFRKMTSPNKITCPNCGGKYKIDKLRVHLKYFCGEGAERTEAQARQRRASENRSNSSATKRTPKNQKKPPMTKTFAKPKSKVKVKSLVQYESESDLSIDGFTGFDGKKNATRPSRAAAKTASKRVSRIATTSKTYATSDDDGSDYKCGNESLESSETETSSLVVKSRVKKRRQNSEASSDGDSGDEALSRAIKKQAKAMKDVKTTKKGPKKGKSFAKAKKGPKKKSFEPDDSSDDEDEDERDPLDGIDLDALTQEAMEGCRFSALHAMCWWRVVLDEAHFIKSRSSQTAASAFSLTAIHRWCLSGTPLVSS
jgi:SNF2-related domain